MKKNLFIVRHGHASFSSDTDFNRNLTERGIQASRLTAAFINEVSEKLQLGPQLCLCSAAIRTMQTADVITKICGVAKRKNYRELYSTHAGCWLELIENTEEESILLVGHNPTMSQLVSNLSGYSAHMKPADCAVIALEIMADGIIYPAKLIDYYSNE